MKCPKCEGQLIDVIYEGFPIKKCNACSGIWLDEPELDEIENTVWNDEDLKGTLEANEVQTSMKCPVCNKQMIKFNYRYYDLEMETCPDMHGFWLDAGGIDRVKELMKKDKLSEKRKFEAEHDWARSIELMRSGGFFEWVKDKLNL
jgi:Zn-finger nucleic acid-binding protein